jgi:short-subunit dehydrogenase
MPIPAPSDSSTALVTGASSGIGEQFARQLSARGHHVTLVARRRDRLEALAKELGGPARATVVAADLGSAAAREGLGTAVSDRDVEVLVNCAGFGVYSPFKASDRSRELAQVRLLVEAVVDLTHRHFGAMCARGRGAIINLSSTSAFQPLPYNAGYAAAKAYVLLLSEALHAEGKEDGVTVTAVCPGPVPTEFQAANGARFAERLPKALWVSPERTAVDSLEAADAGRRMVIPGGPLVQAAFGPNRFAPTALTNPVTKRLMAR